jgi:hypothetical protein
MNDQDDTTQTLTETDPSMSPNAALLAAPRALPAGRGWRWIKDGFGYFRQAPAIWIVIILIYAVLTMAAGAVPLLPLLMNLLTAVFVAGLMLGCQAQHEKRDLQVAHLFAGFKERTGPLVGAGALYLGLIVGVMALVVALGFMTGLGNSIAANLENDVAPAMTTGLLLLTLVAAALFIPVAMAFWFAPALLVFHPQLTVVDAFKLSACGCLSNVMPFLVYGIIAALLAIVAMIPLMLGMLVLGPTLVGAMYVSYREIFLEESRVAQT